MQSATLREQAAGKHAVVPHSAPGPQHAACGAQRSTAQRDADEQLPKIT
jgi:hypothetical protein